MLKSLAVEQANSYSWNWVGAGFCSGHFGEIIQGQFSDPDGGTFRGLVTLCCRSVGTTATVSVGPGFGRNTVPPRLRKVRRVVDTYRRLY